MSPPCISIKNKLRAMIQAQLTDNPKVQDNKIASQFIAINLLAMIVIASHV